MYNLKHKLIFKNIIDIKKAVDVFVFGTFHLYFFYIEVKHVLNKMLILYSDFVTEDFSLCPCKT